MHGRTTSSATCFINNMSPDDRRLTTSRCSSGNVLGTRASTLMIFVAYDDKRISWSRDLKAKLKRGRLAEFVEQRVRESLLSTTFTKSNLYFDRTMDDMLVRLPVYLPHTGD